MSGHSRIIWTCAWSNDSKYFATGGRDKLLNIWLLEEKSEDEITSKVETFNAPDSITAVDFSPLKFELGYFLSFFYYILIYKVWKMNSVTNEI